MDHHKKHGFIFSPRLNLSYKAGNFTTFRLNSGTGFRIVNVFSEDHAAYHGIREVVIVNEIKPEQSVNATFSVNHLFNLGSTVFTLDADVFYTHFTNKIIADYDTDPTKLIYSNLEGENYAVSRGVSSSVQAAFDIPLRISLGATYQDVFSMEYDEAGVAEKHERIKVPRLTGLYTISYDIASLRTSVDLNGTYTSSMRMPQFDAPFERPAKSPAFFMHNLMINHKVAHNAQVYFEIKNLGNFKQESPIINPFNPFDDTFDTSYSYGPLRGRRFVLGFRMFVG
jgi:outer membrane receptor for ferrienterochelin and colicins